MRDNRRVRAELPSGTVTFLFTDIEGSTKLLHELGAELYAQELAAHRRVVREHCSAHGGVEVDTQGDAFFFSFATAFGAVAAARAITEAMTLGLIHLRIGLHTGTPLVTDEGYVGDDVHFAARVAASAHGGQVVLSQATRALVDGPVLTELGEHRFKDIEQAVSIYQLGEKTFPPLKTISNSNLPRPASSFVGRERELAELLAKIEGGARLLTLTGPGGSGKTRLAIEAATTLITSFKAGVFWIGLASLRDSSLVTETLAQTLGARDGLAEHIGEREMLLLLDNLEQVIEAAPELSALVSDCPNLTLLCTSRELLRVRGEVEFSVRPLKSSEAVTLFCERSELQRSEEIVELCARLDDLPLAVELAAARTRVLSPAQILDRLSERLDLLKGGRDAEARQQTLRATIAWSYDLLTEPEQAVFRYLSVFSGGCTLDAAEEVAQADIDTLQSLVEKSLLRFTDGRYWMLETIREYAAEWLDELPDAKTLRDRHARYFLDQLDERRDHILGTRRHELLTWFESESANFRVALQHLERSSPVDAARAAGHLKKFWAPLGRWREGRERCEALLVQADLPTGTRAGLLGNLADYAVYTGDNEEAESLAREALRLAEEAGELQANAFLLHRLSWLASNRGDRDEAMRLSTHLLKEAGDDEWLRFVALGDIAFLDMEAGRLDEARAKLLESNAGFRARGEEASAQVGMVNLGLLELYTHDFDAARQTAETMLDHAGSDLWQRMASLTLLGLALVGLDRRAEARDPLAETLDLLASSGMTGTGVLTDALGGIAHATEPESHSSAARLLGAAHRMDNEAALNQSIRRRELEEFFAQPLIAALGEEEYANQHRLGALMTHDETLELAWSLVLTAPPPDPGPEAVLSREGEGDHSSGDSRTPQMR